MRILLFLSLLFFSIAGNAQLDLVKEIELESIEEQLSIGLSKLEDALKADDGSAKFEALLFLGDLYRSKRNYNKAVTYYRRAKAHSNPFADGDRHYLIQNRLARVLFANAEYEESIEAFEDGEWLSTIGRMYNARIENNDLKARAYIQLGKLESAKDIYLSMHKIAIVNIQDTVIAIDALAKAAEVSNDQGQYKGALEILQQTDVLTLNCETDPNVDIFLQKARAFNKLGRSKEALSELLKAEESGLVYEAEIQKQIAQVYLNLGKKKDALNYTNKAIQNGLIRNDNELLLELYGYRAGIQKLTKSFEGSLESLKASSELIDRVRTKEILDQSKRLRIEDYMVNVENRFRQRSLRSELEASDEREEELRKEAEKLEKEKALLEQEKQQQELALLEERAAVNAANLKTAELGRQRTEQEARLLRQQNERLRIERDLENLDEKLFADSLMAAQTKLKQKAEIEDYQIREAKAAFEAEQKEETLKRNRLLALVLGLGLIIAGGLWFNTRRLNKKLGTQNIKIQEQREQVETERERAEKLLLNVLPKSIAEELKLNGVAAPEKYESASVLFTDFVGFTSISSTLAPEEIIEELNQCFTTFDQIASRHRLEKIKTIGDSYMCAGGIPDPNNTHASDAVMAGQEMVAFMNQRNKEHRKNGKAVWPIRIGIHTGELVAGVVGSSKFAYDIWGDTVNVASRMERGAEHDSINISEETYQLIKDHFDCKFRGEIDVKNKGLMGMYRVG